MIIAVLVFFAVFFFVEFEYTGKVTYVDKEPYTEMEERQVIVEKELSYKTVSSTDQGKLDGLDWMHYGYVVIENTDNEPGAFTIHCGFRALHRSFTDESKSYILPGESKTLECKANIDFGEDVEFIFSITPGTKKVIETQLVEVTKYRDVVKEKEVTERKTLYERFFEE